MSFIVQIMSRNYLNSIINMKAVKLNIHFKLPDTFKGDLNDAIEEILKYRRTLDKGHSDVYEYNPDEDQYTNFWNMITTTDRVLLAEVWMAEYDNDKKEWSDKDNLKIE
jgi:hypothetical protein